MIACPRHAFAARLGLLLVSAPAGCGADPLPDGAIRVSSGEGSEQNPCLSPGGAELVYTRFTRGYNEGPAELVMVDLATMVEEVLLPAGDGDHVNLPGSCFSPDGGALAFSSDDEDRDEIWTLELSTGTRTRLTYRPDTVNYEPTFDSSGQWLVFQSTPDHGKSAIWRVGKDGSSEEALTSGDDDDRQPNTSPVGDEIVFQSDRGGTWGLWRMGLDGSGAEAVVDSEAEETDVSWSPDGSSLVFATDDCVGRSCIAVWNGTAVDVRVEVEGWYLGAPAMAADGTVYFEGVDGNPERGKETAVYRVGS